VNVFQGFDPVEPFLLKDWLIKNDVHAEVRGLDLMSALGEVPATMGGYPCVWVPAKYVARAKELIDTFHAMKSTGEEWQCSECEEMNPGEFGSCWKCGSDSPRLSQTNPRSEA
jgi:hypothetical protein